MPDQMNMERKRVTVKEVIQFLQALDPDLRMVVIDDCGHDFPVCIKKELQPTYRGGLMGEMVVVVL